MEQATAIVLAAGESRRMAPLGPGTLKALLPYGSSSVVKSVVHSLSHCPAVSRVVVVVGCRGQEVAAHLRDTSAAVVHNPRWPEGMLTSVQAGTAAADPHSGLLICLVDQPWLRSETAAAVVAACPPRGIVIPTFEGRQGHPLAIDAALRGDLLALPEQDGLRGLMQRHPQAVLRLPLSDPGILQDLDTPEDYRRALEQRESMP